MYEKAVLGLALSSEYSGRDPEIETANVEAPSDEMNGYQSKEEVEDRVWTFWPSSE